MYIGPFYFDTKEIFLILAAILLGVASAMGWPLWWFDKRVLLTLVVLMLFTKGLLPSIHNEAFFILAIVTIFASLYLPIFQVVLFYFVSFLMFRLLKVIWFWIYPERSRRIESNMNLNTGQRQTMADFYTNFAVTWITFGLVSPIFVGTKSSVEFVSKLLISLFATIFSLSFALKYKKWILILILIIIWRQLYLYYLYFL